MKFTADDFSRQKWPLLGAMLLITAGLAAPLLALKAEQTAAALRTAAKAERNEFDGKLKRVRNEEREIKEKSALFAALQTRGILGEEQRLEWIELLRDIREKRRLIDLQYEISPRRPLEGPMPDSGHFFASAMRLQLKLLHEEDLTRLLNDLRQHAKALILVRECAIFRTAREADPRFTAPLQAECQIDWVTLRVPPSK